MGSSWYETFRSVRGLAKPSGEALYTYRLKSDEFTTLREVLRLAGLDVRATSAVYDYEAGLLVLFLSEWWRRMYQGGPRSWNTPFLDLGFDSPAQTVVAALVGRGLRFWGRPVLEWDGSRHFLDTLICEGGLPLQLVHKDGAHLRRYLRAILQEVALADDASRASVALQAAENHVALLPRGLRQTCIYTLVRDLALHAWHLQGLLPAGAHDPVGYLGIHHPDWRARLPLELDDATAVELVRQTVLDARDARVRGADQLGFDIELVRINDVTCALQRVLPSGLYSEAAIQAAFHLPREEMPTRLNFFAHAAGERSRPIALATRIPGNPARFRIESVDRADATIFGHHVIQLAAVAATRQSFGPALVPGSVLPDLPMVFEDQQGSAPAELIGAGRTRTRRSPVTVVYAPRSYLPEAAHTCVGLLDDEQAMEVLRLEGSAVFRSIDADVTCTISAGAADEDVEPELQMRGRSAPWRSEAFATFVGLPEFFAGGLNLRPVPVTELQWRPTGPARAWRQLASDCIGDVVVRHVVAGEIRSQARLSILPPELRITARPGGRPELGQLLVEGHAAGQLEVLAPIEVLERVQQPNGAEQLELRAPNAKTTTMDVRLTFFEHRSARLRISFPAMGVRFVDADGNRLEDGASVSLDASAGVRAEAFGFGAGHTVCIHAELQSKALPALVMPRISFELNDVGTQSKSLLLRTIRPDLERLLSLTRDLDATITLGIEATGTLYRRPHQIRVGRYDAVVDLARADGIAFVRPSTPGTSIPSLARVRLQAQHLAQLDVQVQLARRDERDEWRFARDERSRGPWLITAWEGERCIARPLLWTIHPGESLVLMPNADSPLVSSICLKEPASRSDALHRELEELATMPASPDWQVLAACLSTVGTLPSETFDVVAALPHHPTTLVGALLRHDGSLRSLWQRLPDLLFAWEFVPISAWVSAVVAHRNHLATIYERLGALTGLTRDAFLAVAFRWLRELFDDVGLLLDVHAEVLHEAAPEVFVRADAAQHRLEAARTVEGRAMIRFVLHSAWERVCEEHQGPTSRWTVIQHGAQNPPPEWLVGSIPHRAWHAELWQLVDVKREVSWRRPVAFAPLVAALFAVEGLTPPAHVIDWVKRLRAFDPLWFESAYPSFLATALFLSGE